MAVDQEDLDRWYKEGREDVQEGRGSTLNGPWGSVFDGDWEAKNDAYKDGRNDQETDNNESSGGGCFFTTACVTYAGLPDDCKELSILRRFRDGFLRSQPKGQALISRYYEEAPFIVQRIQGLPSSV